MISYFSSPASQVSCLLPVCCGAWGRFGGFRRSGLLRGKHGLGVLTVLWRDVLVVTLIWAHGLQGLVRIMAVPVLLVFGGQRLDGGRRGGAILSLCSQSYQLLRHAHTHTHTHRANSDLLLNNMYLGAKSFPNNMYL